MHVTYFTDYSLRVLLYLGLKEDLATVGEIAKAYGVSQNHMVKVVHQLSRAGFIQSYRGKSGGLRLARDPSSIRIGEFVAELEPMDLLECFNPKTNTCPIQGVCLLERSLHEARRAFVDSLNSYTLADFLKPGAGRTARLKKLGISA